MLGHWVISLLSIGLEWSWSIWIGINLIMMILLSYVLTKTEPISNYQESSSNLKKWLFAIGAFSVLFCWALLVIFPNKAKPGGINSWYESGQSLLSSCLIIDYLSYCPNLRRDNVQVVCHENIWELPEWSLGCDLIFYTI